MSQNLDDLDHKIIHCLKEDGRIAIKSIAIQLDVTEATVKKRLNRILDDQVCKVVAIADFKKCGFDYLLPIGLKVNGDQLDSVAQALTLLPQVFSVNAVSGIQDLEILCATRSVSETEELIDNILPSIPGIKSIDSSLASKVYKFETDWAPL